MTKERQDELRHAIDTFGVLREKLNQEEKTLQARQNEEAEKLDALKRKHAESCRAEALGQPSERERIERQIASAEAKVTGLSILLVEKKADLKKLQDEHAPIQREFASLLVEEKRKKDLAEVKQSFMLGKSELKQIITVQLSLARRVNALRANYQEDPVVRGEAAKFAELLANASVGIRVHETFSADEMKEIEQFKRDAST